MHYYHWGGLAGLIACWRQGLSQGVTGVSVSQAWRGTSCRSSRVRVCGEGLSAVQVVTGHARVTGCFVRLGALRPDAARTHIPIVQLYIDRTGGRETREFYALPRFVRFCQLASTVIAYSTLMVMTFSHVTALSLRLRPLGLLSIKSHTAVKQSSVIHGVAATVTS